MRKLAFALVSVSVAAASVSCGKKKNGGSPMGLGQLFLPLKATVPKGLASGSAAGLNLAPQMNLNAGTAELAALKSRIFSAGPTDFMNTIKSVDSRLAELDKRHQEGARKCIGEEAKEWKLSGLPDATGGMTGTASFWFQCVETMNVSNVSPTTSLTIYFGRKDGYSYLAELSTNSALGEPPTIATLGKVDDASNKSEVWQILLTSEAQTDASKRHALWMYVLGDKTTQNFEMAVGGTGKIASVPSASEGPVSGVGCGIRVKASPTFVYGVGRFHESGSGDGNAGTSGETCEDEEKTVCASTTDLLATDATNCSSLTTFGASIPKLGYAQLKGSEENKAGYALGLSIVKATAMPALTSFNDEASK